MRSSNLDGENVSSPSEIAAAKESVAQYKYTSPADIAAASKPAPTSYPSPSLMSSQFKGTASPTPKLNIGATLPLSSSKGSTATSDLSKQAPITPGDVLYGKSDWSSAGQQFKSTLTGKSPTGESLSVPERIKSGLSATGHAGLGALAVAGTASVAIPVVGEVAGPALKGAYAGVKGAAAAAKAATAAKAAKASEAVGTAVTKIPPVARAAATREATSITKGAQRAAAASKASTRTEIENQIRAAKESAGVKVPDTPAELGTDISKGAEDYLKGIVPKTPAPKEPSYKGLGGEGGFKIEPGSGTGGRIPKAGPKGGPTGGGVTSSGRGTYISEAPSSGAYAAPGATQTSTISRTQEFKNQFAPESQAKFAPVKTDLPGAPGYTKTPGQPSESLTGAPGYTRTPGAPSTKPYPTPPRSTTIGDRPSIEKTFTPTKTNLPAVRETKLPSAPTASPKGLAAPSKAPAALGAPGVKGPTTSIATTKGGLTSTGTVRPIPGSDYVVLRPELNVTGLNVMAQSSKAIDNLGKGKQQDTTATGAGTRVNEFNAGVGTTGTSTTVTRPSTKEKIGLKGKEQVGSDTSIEIGPKTGTTIETGAGTGTSAGTDRAKGKGQGKIGLGTLGDIGHGSGKEKTESDINVVTDPGLTPKPEPKPEPSNKPKAPTKTETKKKRRRLIGFRPQPHPGFVPSSIV